MNTPDTTADTRPLLRLIDATRVILGNCGRGLVYGLIDAGVLESKCLGGRTFVTDASIERLVQDLPSRADVIALKESNPAAYRQWRDELRMPNVE